MTEPLLLLGDCRKRLRDLDEASVDAVVTDPPYELGFMGKSWDAAGVSFQPETWTEVLRVLKPGGHLLAFGGTRTVHRIAVAIEDAGFEIRDTIAWMYGSGFPKSLDVAKAIDARDAAAERLVRARRSQEWLRKHLTPQQADEATGTVRGHHLTTHPTQPFVPTPPMLDALRPLLPEVPEWLEVLVADRAVESENLARRRVVGNRSGSTAPGFAGDIHRGGEPTSWDVTIAHTPEAARWEGWGTALKPSFEPVIVARRPFSGTVAENVLAYGVGGLNIDACRVAFSSDEDEDEAKEKNRHADYGSGEVVGYHGWDSRAEGGNYNPPGRWPGNVVLSHTEDCVPVGTREVRGDGNWTGSTESVGYEGGWDTSEHPRDQRVPSVEQVEVWECSPDCPVRILDEQTGESASYRGGTLRSGDLGRLNDDGWSPIPQIKEGYGDRGGASRFFYCAKTSRSERNAGLEGLAETDAGVGDTRPSGDMNERLHVGERTKVTAANSHPTVKPIALMRWLVRLVTPPGGVVLDPFLGSGSTGCAAALEGFQFVGVEESQDYLAIAEARIRFWDEHGDDALAVVAAREQADRVRQEIADAGQLDLFSG